MVDSITWRTTDLTRWGSGLGSPLSKAQVDINFWVLQTRLLALEDHAASAAVGVADFFINPSNPAQFYEVLTDSTQLGPFTLPQSTWNFTNPPTGAWQPLISYAVNDVFSYVSTLYAVLVAHTSASTFDANATDGLGHNLYQVLFSAVEPALPIFTYTGSGHILTSIDSNNYLRFTNTAGCDVTIPSGVFPVETEIEMRDASTVASGGLTVVGAGGVTINGVFGYNNKTAASGGTIGLKQVATDNWDIAGMLELIP